MENEEIEESGYIPNLLSRGFLTGLWLRVKQKTETMEVAILTAGDLDMKESLVEAQ